MKKIKSIILNVFSRPIFQPVFENLLNLSLKAMNIGEGHNVITSGEKNSFKILNKISGDKTATIFDVGAHTGEWSALLKANYNKKFEVYCFEPSIKSFNELRNNVVDNRFHLEQLAFGDTFSIKYLVSEHVGDSTTRVIDNKNEVKGEEIKVHTIDEYCSKNNITQIDLLKIDVEGYELNILKGAQEMLASGKIKLIQFEFGAESEEKYSLKEFFNFLSGQYKIYRILRHGFYNLKEYRHYYEILTVTNFIAIKNEYSI